MGEFKIRLREGEQRKAAPVQIKAARAEKLDDEKLGRILSRMPDLPEDETQGEEIHIPDKSLPPPKTGKIIDVPIVEKAGGPPVPSIEEGGELEVLRFSPEGDVPLAANISIVFSSPMVPLTGHDDTVAMEVPVILDPTPEGKWRWVGTTTLFFESKGRLPMATKYKIKIPKGTKSITGARLKKELTWTFSTPPPSVVWSYPYGGPHALDAVMFAEFNQHIKPREILEFIKVEAGRKEFSVRPAEDEEIEADPEVKKMAKSATEYRWIAFRCNEKLPAGKKVSVVFSKGMPSAEGPVRTKKEAGFKFSTYSPLKVLRHGCYWEKECRPLMPWNIEFNNPIDVECFEESMVRVDPEVPGLKVEISDRHMELSGPTRGQTEYKVKLDPEIKDIFGQELGSEKSVSFKVISGYPGMYAPAGDFSTVDPMGPAAYSVFTINYEYLDVSLYSVAPEQWGDFNSHLRGKGNMPGVLVNKENIGVNAGADELAGTIIDLEPALKDGVGQAIVHIKPKLGKFRSMVKPGREMPESINAWVQRTEIGLDVIYDYEKMVIWAARLSDGTPMEGVSLEMYPSGPDAVTDSSGLAQIELPGKTKGDSRAVIARKGWDSIILRENRRGWDSGSWRRRSPMDMLRWCVFDDRGMYRPGEEVHIKGWIRREGAGPRGDIGLIGDAVRWIEYRLTGPMGNELAQGKVIPGALGGFDFKMNLPENMNLGEAGLSLKAAGGKGNFEGRACYHGIQVQEFRRPEFEVSVKSDEGPHLQGDSCLFTVEAGYYAGGTLPGAEVEWLVTSTPAQFYPPGRDDFSFGKWSPPWFFYHDDHAGAAESKSYSGRLDALGKHDLEIDFVSVPAAGPTSITSQATVMDLTRQAWSANRIILVHPAEEYVGLKSARPFIQAGKPLPIEIIACDLDGSSLAGREIKISAIRLDYSYQGGKWRETEEDVFTETVITAEEPVVYDCVIERGGEYKITADVHDRSGRINKTEIIIWVGGGRRPTVDLVEQEEVVLIPDRPEYTPGDTAEMLIQSPFWPAEGLAFITRSGLMEKYRISMAGPSLTWRIPITEDQVPNIHFRVDLTGAAPRTQATTGHGEEKSFRPAYASGSILLPMPPITRQMNLQVTPGQKEIEPGGETVIEAVLLDDRKRPVENGEIAVVVVDEAILALTGFKSPNPLNDFYPRRPPGVNSDHSRKDIVLTDPEQARRILAEKQQYDEYDELMLSAFEAGDDISYMEVSLDEGEAPAGEEPFRMRMDFNPLAAFVPTVKTDASGKATIPLKLPDNLTRYRIMAAAVGGEKSFGRGESAITARLPLMVRPSPPRFLNYGDSFELPVLVQNQTKEDLETAVAVKTANLALIDGQGLAATVPAGDRVEFRFPAAAVNAGRAHVSFAAISELGHDAAQTDFRVWSPATTETSAVYGVIDEGAIIQHVAAPENHLPGFGELTTEVSSTALQSLTDAFIYLLSYPFDCSEQIASRMLSVTALGDVLEAFKVKGVPGKKRITKAMEKDIERLVGLQNSDGGFPLWRRGYRSWPFHSIHAAHALVKAQEKGYEIKRDIFRRLMRYLANIENHIPGFYCKAARHTLKAYVLYVFRLAGATVLDEARGLLAGENLKHLSMEAACWLLSVIGSEDRASKQASFLKRFIINRIAETAGAAAITSMYQDDDYLLLYSDRRTDGVVLETLIDAYPESDLIPKLVHGLLAHKKRGRWANTQENCFILLALNKYFNTYEAVEPDFIAGVWLGDRFCGQAGFRGRKTVTRRIITPMTELESYAGEKLLLNKEGKGRLYYRMGLNYASADLRPEPVDHGFTIQRQYEYIDDPGDLFRDDDGVIIVRAGARIRVKLTLAVRSRRYHAALVDFLPAGFEAINSDLAVSGDVLPDTDINDYGYWRRTWYEHQNMRDERVEAFTSLLWEGVYTYTYAARATTPGRFIVPPAKAEEMYSPETFGRTCGEIVVVR